MNRPRLDNNAMSARAKSHLDAPKARVARGIARSASEGRRPRDIAEAGKR